MMSGQQASKFYTTLIRFFDRYVPASLQPAWNHPAGPKTVFFWAPAMKWGLVIAGLGDLISRPVETISVEQATSLSISGLIWCRYSLVIIPKNWSLFSVNFFVSTVQFAQLGRAVHANSGFKKVVPTSGKP